MKRLFKSSYYKTFVSNYLVYEQFMFIVLCTPSFSVNQIA